MYVLLAICEANKIAKTSCCNLQARNNKLSSPLHPNRFAFVRFENKEEATKAIEEHHETEYAGNTVTVEMSKPKKQNFGGRGKSDREDRNV